MRKADLDPVMAWVEDREVALALVGADSALSDKVYSSLTLGRIRRVRDLLDSPHVKGTANASTPEEARKLIVSVIKRL